MVVTRLRTQQTSDRSGAEDRSEDAPSGTFGRICEFLLGDRKNALDVFQERVDAISVSWIHLVRRYQKAWFASSNPLGREAETTVARVVSRERVILVRRSEEG